MLTRRSFLTATASALAIPSTALGSGPSTALGAGQITRHGAPRMKLSLAAYSFREALTGPKKSMSLEDFVDRAAAWDIDAVEPTSYYFPDPATGEYCRRLRRQAFLLGLAVSGTAIRNTFTYPPGPLLDKEIAHVKRWIDLAVDLGAPTIRIFAGDLQKGTTEAQARGWCIQSIQECCEHAASRGVILALENHGGIVATVDQLLSIVKEIKSNWFGVNWDSGNFRSADPYGDLAKAAPYAVVAQIKTEVFPSGVRQDADLRRVVGILREAGYRGFVALEYEAQADPFVAVPRYLAELRRAIAEPAR